MTCASSAAAEGLTLSPTLTPTLTLTPTPTRCGSPEHEAATSLAYLAIVLYPVGIPLLYLLLLVSARGAIAKDQPTQLSSALSFLHRDFEARMLSLTPTLALALTPSLSPKPNPNPNPHPYPHPHPHPHLSPSPSP